MLLPLLPMTVMLAGEGGLSPEVRSWVTWANMLGSWTLFPLLKKDELRVPYLVLTLLWGWLMGLPSLVLRGTEANQDDAPYSLTRSVHGLFYLAMLLWHVGDALVATPEGKPDMWVVVNVLIGTAGFGICYLWCLGRLLWAVWQRSAKPERRLSTGKAKAKVQ